MEVGVVGEGVDEPGVNKPGPDDPGPLGESGWSADRRAKELRARGKSSAGAWEAGALGERRVAPAGLEAIDATPPWVASSTACSPWPPRWRAALRSA